MSGQADQRKFAHCTLVFVDLKLAASTPLGVSADLHWVANTPLGGSTVMSIVLVPVERRTAWVWSRIWSVRGI